MKVIITEEVSPSAREDQEENPSSNGQYQDSSDVISAHYEDVSSGNIVEEQGSIENEQFDDIGSLLYGTGIWVLESFPIVNDAHNQSLQCQSSDSDDEDPTLETAYQFQSMSLEAGFQDVALSTKYDLDNNPQINNVQNQSQQQNPLDDELKVRKQVLRKKLMPRTILTSNFSVPVSGAILAMGGTSNRGVYLKSVDCFDFSKYQWFNIGKMQYSRADCGVGVVDGKVYVVGGRCKEDMRQKVDILHSSADPCTSPIPVLKILRTGLGVGAIKNQIYAVGGYNGVTLKSVELLDMTEEEGSKKWKFVADMNSRRSSMGLGVLDDKLFVVGGQNGEQVLSSAECYNPETNLWRDISSMHVPRQGAGVGVLDGFLYCIGGWNHNLGTINSVEKYNPHTQEWTFVAEMYHSRQGAGVLSHQGRLYVFGGKDGRYYLDSMEEYDPLRNKWRLLSARLTTARAFMGVTLISPRVYSSVPLE